MNLKELRKSKNITQRKACEIVDVPLRTYKRYENDSTLLNSKKYKIIYAALKKYNFLSNDSNSKKMNITVVGIGYVGLSIAVLLSDSHNVTIIDIDTNKVDLVNNCKTPFKDEKIEEWFKTKKLNIRATLDKESYGASDLVIIATPTNFDSKTNCFDTSSVQTVYEEIRNKNKDVPILIKSTIPIGFCDKFGDQHLFFSPEFLREGHSLEDCLHPSRIIVGHSNNLKEANMIGNLFLSKSFELVPVLYMTCKEAESVKLFANSYLAMRVAFFNELDTYAETNGLSTKQIIEGISQDARIGDYYNNPSFGYGGYCLPKDTEQLKSSFLDIPNSNLIKAIVESNVTRKEYIANKIVDIAKAKTNKKINDLTIGVYRLIMKTGSDNFRSSAVIDIVEQLKNMGVKVVVFEYKIPTSLEVEITDNFEEFANRSDLIIANRFSDDLLKVKEKVYTRDLFVRD